MCRGGVSHPPGRQTPVVRACFTPHTHCTLQGPTHGGSQFQVRPSSNAFSAFHSAGENALADDLFKVCALFFYASSASWVMHRCATTGTPLTRRATAALQHTLSIVSSIPSQARRAQHSTATIRHQNHTSSASVEGTLQHICYGTALAIT